MLAALWSKPGHHEPGRHALISYNHCTCIQCTMSHIMQCDVQQIDVVQAVLLNGGHEYTCMSWCLSN